jgi:DNA-binding XRE family transcriptional regulator
VKETIATVVKAARIEGLGETRAVFAQFVGVSEQTVYYWDTGKRTPNAKGFARLLEYIPPHFALRLLRAAGMPDPEAWVIQLEDAISTGVASPLEVFGND